MKLDQQAIIRADLPTMIASIQPKFLQRHAYDTQVVLGNLGRLMVSTMVIDQMGQRVLDELVQVLNLQGGGLVILKDQKPQVVASQGQLHPGLAAQASLLLTQAGGKFLYYQ